MATQQSFDPKDDQYADENADGIDTDIPDLAGSSGNEILVEFIDAGVENSQRHGQSDLLQPGCRVLTDSTAKQHPKHTENQKVGTFPQQKGKELVQNGVCYDFLHIVDPEYAEEKMQGGITDGRGFRGCLVREPEDHCHPDKGSQPEQAAAQTQISHEHCHTSFSN